MSTQLMTEKIAEYFKTQPEDCWSHSELRLPGKPHQQVLQAADGLLQINRECENYAKRIDACSPYLYPHRGAGKYVNIIINN